MPKITLFLFGEPQLVVEDQLLHPDRRKALALLAYLALAEQRQSRDHLTALLWPDLDQQRARAALRSTIYALTTLAPGAWLDKTRGTLALNREAMHVDVHRFLSLLQRSRSHDHGQQVLCAECVQYLEQAAEYYRADFMAGFLIGDNADYDDWQQIVREWLRREYANTLSRLAIHWSMQSEFEKALGYARRWLALDPLHEPAHRLLMRIYAASGQRAEALRQYQSCAELLQTELATVPEDETTRLYASLRSDSKSIRAMASTQATGSANVLPPLPALIIGREQALGDLKQRLGLPNNLPAPVIIVQGWPGVGKSTTVAALAHDSAISEFFPDGILWTSLGETPNMLGELSIWAEALGLKLPAQDQSIEQLSIQLTAALRERRMLLIVDDIWQTEHFGPFKVGGQSCTLLATSRLNQVAEALAPTAADVYRLAVLADDAALELLRQLAPDMVAQYPQAARDLVHDLEGLPLAIQVAGRLLHNEARLGWGVDTLLAELRAGAHLLQAQAPGDLAKLGQTPTPTIAALLKRSTDALDPQTQQFFALLGLFVPKPATFDLGAMAAAWDLPDPRPIARMLVNRGLLEPIGGGRFQMHALLVMHARMILEAV